MKIRIELTPNKSPGWKWVLRVIRKHPTYRFMRDAGVEVHWIDLTEYEFPLFSHIEDLTSSWRNVNWIVDGQFETRFRALEIIHEAFSKLDPIEAAIWRAQRDAKEKGRREQGDLFDAPSDTAMSPG